MYRTQTVHRVRRLLTLLAGLALAFTVALPAQPAAASGSILGVTPTALTFTSQQVPRTGTAQTVKLTLNPYTLAVVIRVDGDFIQENTCMNPTLTLYNTRACEVKVTFKPTTTGVRTGAIYADNQRIVGLSGTGTNHPIAVDELIWLVTSDHDDLRTPTSFTGNVMANDLHGHRVALVAGEGPRNGTLAMDAQGNFTYTTFAWGQHTDRFAYVLYGADGQKSVYPGVVRIIIGPELWSWEIIKAVSDAAASDELRIEMVKVIEQIESLEDTISKMAGLLMVNVKAQRDVAAEQQRTAAEARAAELEAQAKQLKEEAKVLMSGPYVHGVLSIEGAMTARATAVQQLIAMLPTHTNSPDALKEIICKVC